MSAASQKCREIIIPNGDAKSERSICLISEDAKEKTLDAVDDSPKQLKLSWRKTVVIVILSVGLIINRAEFALIPPFFPVVAANKGVSFIVVGVVFSSYQFVVVVTSFVYASHIQHLGPKFMYVTGLAVCGCCSILFGLIERAPDGTIFISLCFMIRTIEAFGASAFMTVVFSLAGHLFPVRISTVTKLPSHTRIFLTNAYGSLTRSQSQSSVNNSLVSVNNSSQLATTRRHCLGSVKGEAFMELFRGLGLLIGPSIGGILYQAGGYGLPFWVVGTLMLLLVIPAACLMPSYDDSFEKKERGRSSYRMLKNPLVCLGAFNLTMLGFSTNFIATSLAQRLKIFSVTPIQTGFIFVCMPGMYSVLGPFVGWLLDRTKRVKSFLIVGSTSLFIALMLVGPCPLLHISPSLIFTICSLMFVGASASVFLASSFRALLEGAKQMGYAENLETYGVASGFLSCFVGLGAFFGPMFGGVAQQYLGFQWGTSIVAVLLLLSVMFSTLYAFLTKSCKIDDYTCCCVIKTSYSSQELQHILKEQT